MGDQKKVPQFPPQGPTLRKCIQLSIFTTTRLLPLGSLWQAELSNLDIEPSCPSRMSDSGEQAELVGADLPLERRLFGKYYTDCHGQLYCECMIIH